MPKPFDDQPYNPFNTRTGDNRSFAQRPGLIPLSQVRLQRFHPELFVVKPWMFWLRKRYREDELFKTHVAEHLRYGLAEPAIVVGLDPLLIAAYTNEIDCVAFLAFYSKVKAHPVYGEYYPQGLADELIKRHNLRIGSRLLSVNTFERVEVDGYAPDLIPGPKARGVYGHFSPFIADFLTLAPSRVEERKALIKESEWQRCQQLADEYFESVEEDAGISPRDGRLMTCLHGDSQQWLPGHAPPHAR
jgi:hypothetical protein